MMPSIIFLLNAAKRREQSFTTEGFLILFKVKLNSTDDKSDDTKVKSPISQNPSHLNIDAKINKTKVETTKKNRKKNPI